MARARKLMKETKAHSGFLVHHTPKDGRGTFGSVSIPASVDVILDSAKSELNPNTATLTCERMRRAPAFDPMDVEFASIQVEPCPTTRG